jgi:hypothetical protein
LTKLILGFKCLQCKKKQTLSLFLNIFLVRPIWLPLFFFLITYTHPVWSRIRTDNLMIMSPSPYQLDHSTATRLETVSLMRITLRQHFPTSAFIPKILKCLEFSSNCSHELTNEAIKVLQRIFFCFVSVPKPQKGWEPLH